MIKRTALAIGHFLVGTAIAQADIYRCGHDYTSNIEEIKGKNCVQVSGKNGTANSKNVRLTPSTQEPIARTIADIKRMYPTMVGLDDNQIIDVLHQEFYPDLPREQVASSLGVKPPKPPKQLGPIDKWRHESCLQDAAGKPTPQGVALARSTCDKKFDQ